MQKLSFDQCQKIVAAAFQKAGELKLKPMGVAVFDADRTLRIYCGQDGNPPIRAAVAQGKAWAALEMGFGTRRLVALSKERPEFVASVCGASNGRMIVAGGGVIIRDAQGTIVGAVGASGDTAENDELCAIAGIEAIGLSGDGGQ